MKIGRNIIIGVTLALSGGSAIVASAAVPAIAVAAPAAHAAANPNTLYRG